MRILAEINALLDKFEQKRGKIDLSLGRIKSFLEKIGNPQLKIAPVIHFAGTNGKGSTIAFLKAIIEAGGQSCHVYTSPHLVRFNERIAINGKDIDNSSLLEILREVDQKYEQHKHEIELTFFELTTVVAFVAFAKFPAEYTLLETGLGGRFDATNLVLKPRLTVITPISIDHTEFLGTALAGIAYEKAGIIKPDVTCISAAQVAEVEEVLQKAADEKHAPLIFAQIPQEMPILALKGEHQKTNAATAITAARQLGLSEQAINTGLANAKWPARMQRLNDGELVKLLPENCELWLDGAHNIAGAQALAAEIAQLNKPVYLIAGMLNNKDAASYFAALKSRVSAVYTIPIPNQPNSFTAAELKTIAENAGLNAVAAANTAAALEDIAKKHSAPTSIFICGSLYLAGHILESNS